MVSKGNLQLHMGSKSRGFSILHIPKFYILYKVSICELKYLGIEFISFECESSVILQDHQSAVPLSLYNKLCLLFDFIDFCDLIYVGGSESKDNFEIAR
jgi:hypothetical protein